MSATAPKSAPGLQSSLYYVRSLSVVVRSHEEDESSFPEGGYMKELAMQRREERERKIIDLPNNFRSWVIAALRKKNGELKYSFNTWKRKCGLPYIIEPEKVEAILSKAEAKFSPIASSISHQLVPAHHSPHFSHSEEDLEALLQFCHQNKVADNLFSKIIALSSRHDVISALNHLRLRTYRPNQLILLQVRNLNE